MDRQTSDVEVDLDTYSPVFQWNNFPDSLEK